MGKNQVLDSTRFLVENSKYVRINDTRIKATAQQFAQQDFIVPAWDAEVFLKGKLSDVSAFFLLANTINFAFTNFTTGEKYKAGFNGQEYRGAYAMYAAMMQAIQDKIPILDGTYLKNTTQKEVENIFCRTSEIPMLAERVKQWNDTGRVLCDRYSGSFIKVIEESRWRLFDNGSGLVERLANEFPSFEDSTTFEGRKICFNKRAQLGPAELHARYLSEGLVLFSDIEDLSGFADYELPKGLRSLGILEYSPELAEKIDNGIEIPKETREEIEIRAAMLHAFDRLLRTINELRTPEKQPINVLHLDYKLWSETRKTPGRHHLTRTTAY